MNSDHRELYVIALAMFCFLVICVTAMVLFFRQLRKERNDKLKRQEQERARRPL